VRARAIIWDLDGTLLDTLDDLADSANRALASMGFPVHPVEDYRYFVGDGIDTLMRRILPEDNPPESLVREGVVKMKAIYTDNWNVKTRPYDGINALLDRVRQDQIGMAVFSNKPDEFTRLCVSHYFEEGTFAEVRGHHPETPLKPSPIGALAISRKLGVDPADCLYVGDTATDMKTAVAAGMFPIGALWGFRDRQELLESGANLVIAAPRDILALLRTY
jgi:phosphoglycolate phosphatase